MAKECCICGKKKVSSNQISHSHRISKRTCGANLQKIKLDDGEGKAYVCTKCLKTLKKSN